MSTSTNSAMVFPDYSHLPHVVIAGGGFAGIAAARGFIGKDVKVTIIDQHNFHTFLPLLYQVATAALEPAEVAYPIRTIFGKEKNIGFRHGQIMEVDHEAKHVRLNDGAVIGFDHLVIATGATAAYFGIPGASKFAMPLYSLSDSRKLRNTLLMTLESADVEAEEGKPVTRTFVVVGGGPTGVETSGAIAELIRIVVRRDGLRIDPANIRVLLVDMAPRLLTPFPEKVSTYTAKKLREMGIEIQFGRSVVEVQKDSIRFDDGEELEVAGVIWAAGVTANGTLASAVQESRGPSGRLRVGSDLRLAESDCVWAIGDSAAIHETDTSYLAQLAPVAIQSGRHVAKQILSVIDAQPTKPFKYHDKGIMATIGRHAAVAKLPTGQVIKGTAGWLAWLGLHLWYLVGFRNRLRVMINWTWRYFDWPSGPRLIVADAETAD